MKRLLLSILAITALTFSSCSDDDQPPVIGASGTCNDGIKNNGETEVDCGGSNCQPCNVAATCADGIQNGTETGVDCGGSCDPCTQETGISVTVSDNVTVDTEWIAENSYVLDGRVFVSEGATLTIQPGTIIKANAGTGANASVLVVTRGSKIEAVGTATQPIIFTSAADNIAFGQTAGTNLDQNDRGLWGGLIILGNAPASFDGDATAAQIEGIPSDTDGDLGLYGGTDSADNSGTVQYVSIRHGGALIGESNEINGLTLGAVGSGTTIDNVEVVGNVDDGVEFFGGTVDATNLFVWAQGDDGLDIDQAYSGTIDNAVVVQGDISDHALEIDGPEGSATGSFTLTNVTLIGLSDKIDGGQIADYRSGATGSTNNILVTGFTGIGTTTDADGDVVDLELSNVELDNDGVAAKYTNGTLLFSAWEVVLPMGVLTSAEIFDDRSTVGSTFEADAANFSSAVTEGTVGADTSAFSWTYSNAKAQLGF